MSVAAVILILALVFFVLSAIPIPTRGIAWMSWGLVCLTLYFLILAIGDGGKLALH